MLDEFKNQQEVVLIDLSRKVPQKELINLTLNEQLIQNKYSA